MSARSLRAAIAAELGPDRVSVVAAAVFGDAETVVHLRRPEELPILEALASAHGARLRCWHGGAEPIPRRAELLVVLRPLREVRPILTADGAVTAVHAGGGATVADVQRTLALRDASLGPRSRCELALPLGAWLRCNRDADDWPRGVRVRPTSVLGWRPGAGLVTTDRWAEIATLEAICAAEIGGVGVRQQIQVAAWRCATPRAAFEAMAAAVRVDPEAELDVIAAAAVDRAGIWTPAAAAGGSWTGAAASLFPAIAGWLDRLPGAEDAGCWVVAQVAAEPGVAQVRMATLDHLLRARGATPAAEAEAIELRDALPAEATFPEVTAQLRGQRASRAHGFTTPRAAGRWLRGPACRRIWTSFRMAGPEALVWRQIDIDGESAAVPPLPVRPAPPLPLQHKASTLARLQRRQVASAASGPHVVIEADRLWASSDTRWRTVCDWIAAVGVLPPLLECAEHATVADVLAMAGRAPGTPPPNHWLPGARPDAATLMPWLQELGVVWSDGQVSGVTVGGPAQRALRLDAIACRAARCYATCWQATEDGSVSELRWRGPRANLPAALAVLTTLAGLERALVQIENSDVVVRLRLRGRRPLVRRGLDRIWAALPGARLDASPWPTSAPREPGDGGPLQRWQLDAPPPAPGTLIVDLDAHGGWIWPQPRGTDDAAH